MKKLISLLISFLLVTGYSSGQDAFFSQYQYSPLLINPAYTASDYELKILAHYRNQYRNPDPNYRTPSFTFILPFVNKENRKNGGIGLNAYSDQTGNYPRYQNQGISLSYAYNLFMGRGCNLSLGLQGGYYQYGFSAQDVETSEQYQNNGGFNANLPSGEGRLSNRNKQYIDLNSGLSFIKEDTNGLQQYYIGISIYHLTKPDRSFLGKTDELSMAYSVQAGIRVFAKNQWTVFPEVLAIQQLSYRRISAGVRIKYTIETGEKKGQTSISLIPRYNHNNSMSAGIELSQSNFLVAFSYDFNTSPVADRMSAMGAYEIAIGYRKSFYKPKEKKPLPEYTLGDLRKFYRSESVDDISKKLNDERQAGNDNDAEPDYSDTTWFKKDNFQFELSKNFVFGFNETVLGKEAKEFADEMIALMKGNKKLRLLVTGYTDNVGSETVNLTVSKQRAQAFTAYMEAKGINPKRLKADGKGETQALNDNRTKAERAKNRRIIFLLY